MTNGLIFDIKRFAVHDGPGIRTTVFFKGCPLSCMWCHNPESRSPEPQTSVKHIGIDGITFEQDEITGKEASVEEIVKAVERDRIFYEESGGGVTLSGGEPLFQIDFCVELLQALKKEEFHTALDTTGHASPEEIQRIIPFTDLFLYDLKLMDDEEHQIYTGVSNKMILENLKFLMKEGKYVIIRIPVVPGITDTDSNIHAIIDFLKSLPRPSTPRNDNTHEFTSSPTHQLEIDLLPYHSIAKNKYRRFHMSDAMEPGLKVNNERLDQIKRVITEAGFLVKAGG